MLNKIIFIGGGNMAEAIFAQLLTLSLPIIVIQRNEEKRKKLAIQYPAITFLAKLEFNTTIDDLVILAIKPQDAKFVCNNIAKSVEQSTIISVMAGISLKTLATWLNNFKLVRTMPNTPSLLGHGVTGIYFNPEVLPQKQQIVKLIFQSIGKIYVFDEEQFIDKITAIAGSSPAYIFYFIESMLEAAITTFGFNAIQAREITLQVVKGSLAMIENNPHLTIKQLRDNVTSKKGATEEAIKVFTQYNLPQIITEAEIACYNRSCELGKLYK